MNLSEFADRMNAECCCRTDKYFCPWDGEDLNDEPRNYCSYDPYTLSGTTYLCLTCERTLSKLQTIRTMTACVESLQYEINTLKTAIDDMIAAISD